MNLKLKTVFKEKFKTSFIKNLAIMVLGVGAAQLISFMAIPILTRLYSPEQFGIFSIFSSGCMTLSVISSFRYDGAIPLPKKSSDAQALTYLSCFIATVFALTLCLILASMDEAQFKYLNLGSLIEYKWLIPIGSALGALYLIFHYWSVRQNDFKVIAKTRFSQNLALNSVQVVLGLWKPTAWGLLIGFVAGQFFGIRILFSRFLASTAGNPKVGFHQLKTLAVRYKDFAIYSTPAMLINSISLAMPPVALGLLYGMETAGLYSLVQRLLAIPMNLIGNSISQVFLGELTRLIPEGIIPVKALFYGTFKKLLLLGTLVLLLGLVLKFSIGFLFGLAWARAGDYCIIMSFLFFTQLLAIPLSQVVNVFERQRMQLALDLARLTMLVVVFVASDFFHLNDLATISTLSIVVGLCYLLSLLFYCKILNEVLLKWGLNGSNSGD